MCDVCEENVRRRVSLQLLHQKLTGTKQRVANNAEIARLEKEYNGFMMCNTCASIITDKINVIVSVPALTTKERKRACMDCMSEGMTLYNEMKRTGSSKKARELIKLGAKCHACVDNVCKKSGNKYVCFAATEVQRKIDRVVDLINSGGDMTLSLK